MDKCFQAVRLGEVLIPIRRSEPVVPDKTYHILGAHWYAKGLYTKDIKNGSQIQARNLYRVESGDFVYNRLFAWKGSFAVASEENDGCYVSNEFPCFLVNHDRLDSSYLWRYFSRAAAWEEALGLSAGGTPTSRNRLKEDRLLAMKMPLPMLEEQRRIAAKIDELVDKIEEARRLRHQATEEGKAIPRALADVVFRDIKTRVQLGEGLFGLICRYPTFYNIVFTDKGVGLLKISNLTQEGWRIQFDNPRDFISQETNQHFHRTILEAGDLVMAARGATIGKTAYVTEEFAGFNINANLLRLKPNTAKLEGKYFWYFMCSNLAQNQFQALVTSTAKQTITIPKLKSIYIPLPPVAEQCRIVAYLNGFAEKVDALKCQQNGTAAEIDAFLPSILDKAFKGEL